MNSETDDRPREVDEHKTQPAEEWGERIETSRDQARGGRSKGEVPGATDEDSDDPRANGEGGDDGSE